MPDKICVKSFLTMDGKTEIRRFYLTQETPPSYAALLEKLNNIYPQLAENQVIIKWKDREGDVIRINSDEELMDGITETHQVIKQEFLKIYVRLQQNDSVPSSASARSEGDVHEHVKCNGCKGAIRGFRYMCLKCNDYDLCANCEVKGVHAGHNMIRLVQPASREYPWKKFLRRCQRWLTTNENDVSMNSVDGKEQEKKRSDGCSMEEGTCHQENEEGSIDNDKEKSENSGKKQKQQSAHRTCPPPSEEYPGGGQPPPFGEQPLTYGGQLPTYGGQLPTFVGQPQPFGQFPDFSQAWSSYWLPWGYSSSFYPNEWPATSQSGAATYSFRLPCRLVPVNPYSHSLYGRDPQSGMDASTHATSKSLPHWVAASNGDVPPGALIAGQERGEPLFIARAHHLNTVTLGKLQPSHKTCYISYGGEQLAKPNYEVLVNLTGKGVFWTPAQGKKVPPGALQGGIDNGGTPLFIARANHQENQIPGKVNANYGLCYFPYGGKEEETTNYEALVLQSVPLH